MTCLGHQEQVKEKERREKKKKKKKKTNNKLFVFLHQKMKLTTEIISEIYQNKPLESLKEINVSKKEIDQVEDISACKQLRKLQLAHNELVDEKSIAGLKNLDEMILLNLSNNKFKDFTGFQHFQKLNGKDYLIDLMFFFFKG